MKKLVVLVSALLICMMLPAMALAISQEEWDQECWAKTSGIATLNAIESDPTTMAGTVQMKEIGFLPGGTYIKTGEYNYDLRMWKIAYLKDDIRCEAWVEKNVIIDATTVVYYDDGSTGALPEALVTDKEALLRHLKTVFPDRSYSIIEGSSMIHVDQSQPTATPQPVKDPNTDTSGKVKGEWKPNHF